MPRTPAASTGSMARTATRSDASWRTATVHLPICVLEGATDGRGLRVLRVRFLRGLPTPERVQPRTARPNRPGPGHLRPALGPRTQTRGRAPWTCLIASAPHVVTRNGAAAPAGLSSSTSPIARAVAMQDSASWPIRGTGTRCASIAAAAESTNRHPQVLAQRGRHDQVAARRPVRVVRIDRHVGRPGRRRPVQRLRERRPR